MGKKWMIIYIACLFLLFLALTFFNCKTSDETGTLTVNINNLPGTWKGSWIDTVYNVSGAVNVTFTVNGDNITATGSINLKQIGFGVISGTGTGTISGDTVAFSFTAAGLGTGNGTLTGSAGSGSGSVTGGLNFGPFTFSGTMNGSQMTGSFDFTNPGGGAGSGTLTKE